jgi:hypothetical protein
MISTDNKSLETFVLTILSSLEIKTIQTSLCPKLTRFSYRPARLLATDFFQEFSPSDFLPDFFQISADFIKRDIPAKEHRIFVFSDSNKPRESERVRRKCVGLTGLFPTCHGGQLTLKLWVTKQGSHPRSIM